MTNPTYTLEVAFSTANPLTDPGSWTDVTAFMRSFTTNRGRPHELDRTQAGTLDVELRNTDRRFDPTYSGGPYFGNVLPMKQVRLRATFSAVTYDLFRGYVEDWSQGWDGRPITNAGGATCQLHATDAFKVLNFQVFTPYRTVVLADSPVVYVPFDGAAGTSTAENLGSAGGTFPTTMAGILVPGRADSPIAAGVRRSMDVDPIRHEHRDAYRGHDLGRRMSIRTAHV